MLRLTTSAIGVRQVSDTAAGEGGLLADNAGIASDAEGSSGRAASACL